MQNNTILISLVSKQSMPVIIPALYLKPDKVILITTHEEKHTAKNIINVLNNNKISCELSGNTVRAYDYKSTESEINRLISSNPKKILLLNTTGGTKIMAIAAYESFRKANLETIYCDTNDNKIFFMEFGKIRSENFNVKVSVKDYLSSCGFNCISSRDKLSRMNENIPLLNFISDNLEQFLNFHDYLKQKFKNKIKSKSIIYSDFEFDTSESKYILYYKNREIFTSDIKNINYIKGFWLEDYVFMKLKEKSPDDIVVGANVRSGMNNLNEIDILLTKNGRLHLISCKAGNADKQDLFELDGLRDLAGGTFGIASKVTIKKMNRSFINRARELKINLINIKQIESIII